MPPLILAPLSGAPPPPPPGLSVFPPPFSPPISRTLDRYSRRCTKSLASWPVGEKNSCYGSHLVASYPGDRQANPCVRHLTLLHADSVSLRGLALEQVRHVGDDRVLAEEKCPLDEKGRLVVQEVLPPSPREEFRQNDRDHLLVASRLDLVDVVEKRPQERPIGRRQDDHRNAEPPLAPLLLHLGGARGVRLHEDPAHRGRRRERLRVLHGAHDPAVDVAARVPAHRARTRAAPRNPPAR